MIMLPLGLHSIILIYNINILNITAMTHHKSNSCIKLFDIKAIEDLISRCRLWMLSDIHIALALTV